MKTCLFKIMVLSGIFFFMCGCSSDENVNGNDLDLSELVIDDYIGDVWDGENVPSWLNERYYDFIIKEKSDWLYESYYPVVLFRVYKFNYQDNLLLALTYNRFGYRGTEFYYAEGTLCYTGKGQQVNFSGVKNSFEKNAELVWSNELGGENHILNVSDFGLDNEDSSEWLQKRINQICENIQEPAQILDEVAIGYVQNDGETGIALRYSYFDKADFSDGPISVYELYTLNGESIEYSGTFKNEILCVKSIKNMSLLQ